MESPNSEDFASAEGLEDIPEQEEEERKQTEEPPKVFQCSCGKSYMSYSALYSHNKQKHGGEPTNLPSGRGGRKRGRPPKNGDHTRTRPKPSAETRQEDDSYFRIHRLLGGPVDPRLSLSQDSPLYSLVETLLQNPASYSEETATCADAFAAYLIAMAGRLTADGQAQVTEFVEKLMDCADQKEGEGFCETNSPQTLPERANDFVTEYLESANLETLNRSSAIDLMMHFCKWLFEHRFSNLKLSLCDKD